MRSPLTALMRVFICSLIVALPAVANAGIIDVTGVVDFIGQSGGHVALTGPRGFTLTAGTAAFLASIPVANNQSVSPGMPVSLNAFDIGTGFSGPSATLDGVLYAPPKYLWSICPGPCANLELTFAGGPVVAPSLLPHGSTVTFTTPVTFHGVFSHPIDANGSFAEDLTAVALASLKLTADFESWDFTSITYNLSPTPEPATLLLWGTSAAGLGVARWVKRRRSRDHEHAA